MNDHNDNEQKERVYRQTQCNDKNSSVILKQQESIPNIQILSNVSSNATAIFIILLNYKSSPELQETSNLQ